MASNYIKIAWLIIGVVNHFLLLDKYLVFLPEILRIWIFIKKYIAYDFFNSVIN